MARACTAARVAAAISPAAHSLWYALTNSAALAFSHAPHAASQQAAGVGRGLGVVAGTGAGGLCTFNVGLAGSAVG